MKLPFATGIALSLAALAADLAGLAHAKRLASEEFDANTSRPHSS